jgi:hypothetical protein
VHYTLLNSLLEHDGLGYIGFVENAFDIQFPADLDVYLEVEIAAGLKIGVGIESRVDLNLDFRSESGVDLKSGFDIAVSADVAFGFGIEVGADIEVSAACFVCGFGIEVEFDTESVVDMVREVGTYLLYKERYSDLMDDVTYNSFADPYSCWCGIFQRYLHLMICRVAGSDAD